MGVIRPGVRLWLEDQGNPVFGSGICQLLAGVQSTGSLHRAAADMKMAYSKAWTIVQRAEAHLGLQLIERHVGGAAGGGSVLTEDGQSLMAAFETWVERSRRAAEDLFDETFPARLKGIAPDS
jgi:molybdate transport system regulatory protein